MAKTKAELKAAIVATMKELSVGNINGTSIVGADVDTLVDTLAKHLAPAATPLPPKGFHGETPQLYQLTMSKAELYFVHHCIGMGEAEVKVDLIRMLEIIPIIHDAAQKLHGTGGFDPFVERINKIALVAFAEGTD